MGMRGIHTSINDIRKKLFAAECISMALTPMVLTGRLSKSRIIKWLFA